MLKGTADAPRVFVSYAEPDRASAEKLVDRLGQSGIKCFFAPVSISRGENIVLEISKGLDWSDFFLLLLSRHTLGRNWVELEWSSALALEIRQRRAFLFVLRLDETPPPAILAPRNSLDGFADWEGAIHELERAWLRDLKALREGTEVLPAPASSGSNEGIGVFVRNRSFAVQHHLRLAPSWTSWKALARIKIDLALKDRMSQLEGRIGLEFDFRLHYGDREMAAEETLEAAGVSEGAVLDLEIQVTPFSPATASGGLSGRPSYRGGASEPSLEAILAELYKKAFRHLQP